MLQAHGGRPSATCTAAGAHIELRKRIAIGAGLGGGSSDAAAVLAGLNRLWAAGLDNAELSALALQLGSDVPLFLAGPASRMRGRGDVLAPAALKPFAAVLVCPPLSCPTARVYAAYDEMAVPYSQPLDPALLAHRPVEQWPALLENDLYGPACTVCPQIRAWVDRLAQTLGPDVLMTGSGSALFALAPDVPAASALSNTLDNQLGRHAQVVSSNGW
jgi:4-diphosphocytidyl-2-C-methyl-D-erythritol kinase